MSELHQRIKEARHRSGLTQGDIAKLCGLTRNAVTLWESSSADRRTAPQIPEIRIICESTGAPVEWLLSDASGLHDSWNIGGHLSLSLEEKQLVSIYRDCGDAKKSSIRAFLKFTSGEESQTKSTPAHIANEGK